jgi:hypothetical protein
VNVNRQERHAQQLRDQADRLHRQAAMILARYELAEILEQARQAAALARASADNAVEAADAAERQLTSMMLVILPAPEPEPAAEDSG